MSNKKKVSDFMEITYKKVSDFMCFCGLPTLSPGTLSEQPKKPIKSLTSVEISSESTKVSDWGCSLYINNFERKENLQMKGYTRTREAPEHQSSLTVDSEKVCYNLSISFSLLAGIAPASFFPKGRS